MKLLLTIALAFAGMSHGPADAHHNEVGVDPFPWTADGWHEIQRSQAYNIAYNEAVSECSANGLVLDTGSLSPPRYGWVTVPPGYHTAHIDYYCKERAPRYRKQWGQEVSGTIQCNPGAALQTAEIRGSEQCEAKNPRGKWFMGDYLIMSVGQPFTGACGGQPQFTYRYRILPQCWIDMNNL